MKVTVTTSHFGGPYQWGKDLCEALNWKGIEACHVYSPDRQVLGWLSCSGDIAHTTVPFPAKTWKRPVVASIKADYTVESGIIHGFYPRLVESAAVVTVPNQYLRLKLGVDRAVVIPNAVFPDRFPMAAHGTRSPLNLVTVMNFYFKGKADGLVRLADILSMLPRYSRSHLRLIVVGDGPYLEQVKAHAATRDVPVYFSSYLEKPQMALLSSDLFLYYSLHDSSPNVILEAMASELPVLANQVGAVKEMVADKVSGFIAKDDEDYREKLEMLLSDVELRRRMGQQGRMLAETKFNWNLIVDKYVDIYRRVLDGSR